MPSDAKSRPGRIKADLLIRDKDGRPKVDVDQIERFFPHLTDDDLAYLATIYPDHPLLRKE